MLSRAPLGQRISGSPPQPGQTRSEAAGRLPRGNPLVREPPAPAACRRNVFGERNSTADSLGDINVAVDCSVDYRRAQPRSRGDIGEPGPPRQTRGFAPWHDHDTQRSLALSEREGRRTRYTRHVLTRETTHSSQYGGRPVRTRGISRTIPTACPSCALTHNSIAYRPSCISRSAYYF